MPPPNLETCRVARGLLSRTPAADVEPTQLELAFVGEQV